MQNKLKRKNITIYWNAFTKSENSEHDKFGFWWELDETKTDFEICEDIFQQTNLYKGEVFELIAQCATKERSHTALSVGDHIAINGRMYRVNSFGFGLVEESVGA